MESVQSFKSEIGIGVILLIGIPLGGSIIIMFLMGIWIGFFGCLALQAYLVYLYLSTVYIIDGGSLKIKYGFFHSRTVDISSILTIRKSKDPRPAPAFSFNRLEIRTGSDENIFISPKNNEKFIETLIIQNPNITVVGRPHYN